MKRTLAPLFWSTCTLAASDTASPAVSASSATAVADARNDFIAVTFNDRMIPSEVEDPANFTLEHPAGTPISLAGASFDYDEATQTLEILFGGAGALTVNFQTGVGWDLILDAMRDLGGNSIGAAVLTSGLAVGDAAGPALTAATQNETVDPSGATLDIAHARCGQQARQGVAHAGTPQYSVRDCG